MSFQSIRVATMIAAALVAPSWSFALPCSGNWTPPGPAVGIQFPNELALKDQAGRPQSLHSLAGKNGVAVFFVRSADWCPFCQHQLLDLNVRYHDFERLGVSVFSVSMDTVDKIAAFHAKQHIDYTMLSDADGATVERLGIRDPQYPKGSPAYGVARPTIYVLDPSLKVVHKYAQESFKERPDLNCVLEDLGAKAGS